MNRLTATEAPAAVVLIRLMIGCVFLSEGIQTFLFPTEIGAGRFAKIGFPFPELVASFVGCVEIGCRLLALVGFYTRLAAMPLIVVMLTAIISTKLPILAREGFWKMAHEARTDWSMLLGTIFLTIVGGGQWSLAEPSRRKRRP